MDTIKGGLFRDTDGKIKNAEGEVLDEYEGMSDEEIVKRIKERQEEAEAKRQARLDAQAERRAKRQSTTDGDATDEAPQSAEARRKKNLEQ